MGKDGSIKSLSKVIANVALHRLLLKYANKPESREHLEAEVIEYRDVARDKSNEFNWNSQDKNSIKKESSIELRKRIQNYPDINFLEDELDFFLKEILKEIINLD